MKALIDYRKALIGKASAERFVFTNRLASGDFLEGLSRLAWHQFFKEPVDADTLAAMVAHKRAFLESQRAACAMMAGNWRREPDYG